MKLNANNISFSYNKNKQILKDISLSISNDEIIGLIGDSGTGKSTLSKILSGYITDYEGEVNIDGEPIVTKDFYPVQLIFQHPEKTMNPKWHMDEVLSESWEPPKDMRDDFGLKDNWMTRFPNELSGGELQRFSILRALNPKTKFIIADEISTMLDAVTQVQIWTSLIDYCRRNEIGILAVSHDQELLDYLCDDVLYFNELNHV
ncbi:ABC transporter ATP-binding protein [uncultured Methanosphaera sp.]|uniref:ABC transporter ATP-binding protein n=1 Tax=uncultured Methanosphaera sp. TaxID=262501 RepID=UPI000DC31ECA|nr:ATP-binding cassette domain-containing protein [uncultured Methanosphaera sp.]RAP43782.1 MAG: nickel ABC transporter ATP-binding protein [Methanosphaera sp. SHI1033]